MKDEKLEVAEEMAKDFLEIHKTCTSKDLTDVERDNLERIANQARLVTGDLTEYDNNVAEFKGE